MDSCRVPPVGSSFAQGLSARTRRVQAGLHLEGRSSCGSRRRRGRIRRRWRSPCARAPETPRARPRLPVFRHARPDERHGRRPPAPLRGCDLPWPTQSTRTSAARLGASACVSAGGPPLAGAGGRAVRLGHPRAGRGDVDHPPPCPRRGGTNARTRRNGPVRLTARTRCHSSGCRSSSGRLAEIAALLTSTSSRSARDATRSANTSMSGSLPTSASSPATGPRSVSSSTVRCSVSASRSTASTR